MTISIKTNITLNVEDGLTPMVKMPRLSCLTRGQKAAFYDAGQSKKLVLYINDVPFNEGTPQEFKANVLAEKMMYNKEELYALKEELMGNVGSSFDVVADIEPVFEGQNDSGHGILLVGKRGGSEGRVICKIRDMRWRKRENAFTGTVAMPPKAVKSRLPEPEDGLA